MTAQCFTDLLSNIGVAEFVWHDHGILSKIGVLHLPVRLFGIRRLRCHLNTYQYAEETP